MRIVATSQVCILTCLHFTMSSTAINLVWIYLVCQLEGMVYTLQVYKSTIVNSIKDLIKTGSSERRTRELIFWINTQ